MSFNIKNLGWWKDDNEYANRPQKVVLPGTNGKTYVVIPDSNAPEANAINPAYGDGTDTDVIRVFEVDADWTAAVEVATIATGTLMTAYDDISADLYSDNSIGIAYQRNGGGVYYRKVTNGTWVVSAQEAVGTPPDPVWGFDLTISDADVPCVALMKKAAANPKAQLLVYVKGTGVGWTTSLTHTLMTTADPNASMMQVSAQWVKGGSVAARSLMVGCYLAQQGGADIGCRIYTGVVDESTAVLTNWTLQKTVLAGNMTTKWGSFPRRCYLFRSATNEITAVFMESDDKRNIAIARYTFNGAVFTEVMPPQVSTVSKSANKAYRFAASYAKDRVVFYYMVDLGGAYNVINYVGSIDRAKKSVRYSGWYRWDNTGSPSRNRMYPMSGTGRNADTTTKHAAIFFEQFSNKLIQARGQDVDPALAPTAVTPAVGVTMVSGVPQLGMRISLGKQFPQSKHKAVWQVASDAAFNTNLRTYVQDDTKFIKVENTQGTGYVYVTDNLPADMALQTGDWYVRGAVEDEFGIRGPWSPGNQFSISHPPSAINLSPSGGVTVIADNINFRWDFKDPSPGDTQSAFQLIIERNDDGTVVFDSGKVDSTVSNFTLSLDPALAGTLLRWKVRLWDADGTPGNYADGELFAIAAPPTVAIDAPGPGSTVTSGTPTVLFTPTVGDGRRIKKFQVIVLKAGEIVRDSGQVPVDIASGTQQAWRMPRPLLENLENYSVQVAVTDSVGMTGVSAINTFDVAMVEPASASGLIVDASGYNLDAEGYISVSWDDVNRDVDFDSWVVSRRDDLIGMNNIVVEVGEWKTIAEVTEPADLYEYRDYYAPSGYRVNYRVQQLVDRGGDYAISSGGMMDYALPQSEGYWIIQPSSTTGNPVVFRLHSVASDGYSHEHEETEYTIIGRGRHFDRGESLGVKGSLSAKLRDTGETTARQKKLQLEAARDIGIAVYLRNPFGDVWSVNIGDIDISRIAGVGKSEFVDVTVPYSEVASD